VSDPASDPISDRDPAVTVVTERLRLEPITEAHGDELYELHLDPAIAEWWDVSWTRADAAGQAARFAAGWRDGGVSKWMAYLRSSGELVGRGGITRIWLDGADRHEVGWALLGRFWGRGYATEIGQASLTFAFETLGVDEVVAFTEPHNLRSRAVMERLGMTYERDIVHDGYDFVLYAVPRPVTDGVRGGPGAR
jgi:RimJ/RimL family protein N-acetyltransferase